MGSSWRAKLFATSKFMQTELTPMQHRRPCVELKPRKR